MVLVCTSVSKKNPEEADRLKGLDGVMDTVYHNARDRARKRAEGIAATGGRGSDVQQNGLARNRRKAAPEALISSETLGQIMTPSAVNHKSTKTRQESVRSKTLDKSRRRHGFLNQRRSLALVG